MKICEVSMSQGTLRVERVEREEKVWVEDEWNTDESSASNKASSVCEAEE